MKKLASILGTLAAICICLSIVLGTLGLIVGGVVNLVTQGSGEALAYGVLGGIGTALLLTAVSARYLLDRSEEGTRSSELEPDPMWPIQKARRILSIQAKLSLVCTGLALALVASAAYLFFNEATRSIGLFAALLSLLVADSLLRLSWGPIGRYLSAFVMPIGILVMVFTVGFQDSWAVVGLMTSGLRRAKSEIRDAQETLRKGRSLLGTPPSAPAS